MMPNPDNTEKLPAQDETEAFFDDLATLLSAAPAGVLEGESLPRTIELKPRAAGSSQPKENRPESSDSEKKPSEPKTAAVTPPPQPRSPASPGDQNEDSVAPHPAESAEVPRSRIAPLPSKGKSAAAPPTPPSRDRVHDQGESSATSYLGIRKNQPENSELPFASSAAARPQPQSPGRPRSRWETSVAPCPVMEPVGGEGLSLLKPPVRRSLGRVFVEDSQLLSTLPQNNLSVLHSMPTTLVRSGMSVGPGVMVSGFHTMPSTQ